jgi:hypothetical protein
VDQGSVAHERLEVVPRLGVDPGIIGIDVGGQIDLGAADMEEAERIAARQLRRFGAGDDIVRRRGDPADYGGVRPPGAKRLETNRQLRGPVRTGSG